MEIDIDRRTGKAGRRTDGGMDGHKQRDNRIDRQIGKLTEKAEGKEEKRREEGKR